MVRRLSWCAAVALMVLLFVPTEGLCRRSPQVDDHRTASRGTLRFNSKSLEETTTLSSPTLSRSRAIRDRTTYPSFNKNDETTTLSSVTESEAKFEATKQSSTKGTAERSTFATTTESANGSGRPSSRRNPEEIKSTESGNGRRNGRKYFAENNDGSKSQRNNGQRVTDATTNRLSRRTSTRGSSNGGATERLANSGPSVFQASTESSRSRTGRKIQTTYSMKDLNVQVPTSRRYSNKKLEGETTTVSIRREGRGRSTTERIERSTRSGRSKVNSRENNSIDRRGQDTVLSESESIRVDIPLSLDRTDSPEPEATTLFAVVSQRRSDTKESARSNARTGSERSKNRGRSNDSSSRRGSSKFSDYTTTEATEQVVSPKRNSASRDRTKGTEARSSSANETRSRSSGRNVDNSATAASNGDFERSVKRKTTLDRKSRLLDVTSRSITARGQDAQDSRGKSRSRSRSDNTMPLATDVTPTVAPDTTVSSDVTTTGSDIGTTIRPATLPPSTSTSRSAKRQSSITTSTTEASGRGRGRSRSGKQARKQKEDFFNHGLGFRGRKTSPEGSASDTVESRRTAASKNDSQSHGSPGWTLRRRPVYLANSENPSKTVPPSTTDQTNVATPSNEPSTSTEVVTTVESSTSGTNRGLKKPQTTEESTVVDATTKSYRRGNKTFGIGKATAEPGESDNYPPEFKAKLTQLSTKIPALKTTSRPPLEEQQKSFFARRSTGNSNGFVTDDLEASASGYDMTDKSLVVNPLTLISGRRLRRVKKSSAALFAERSRMKLELARSKPKPGGASVNDETSRLAKYTKSSASSIGRRAYTPIESTPVEAVVKATKVSGSRKGLEHASKVTGRASSSKKGRIIAERMVTSISVEERSAMEETTKPYVLSANPPGLISASAGEGSTTTVDAARIRVTGGRRGNKSSEEDSTSRDVKVSLHAARRVEDSDSVATFKPKKAYTYQPRGKASQSTTVDQDSATTAAKKSYASSSGAGKLGAGQKKSQSEEEDGITRTAKFSSSATKPTFRPRYSKRTKQKSFGGKANESEDSLTTKLPVPTSRYSRNKSVIKSVEEKTTTEEAGRRQPIKKIEFRPRTATYRRHSEIPTTLVETSTKVGNTGVAITPKAPRFHATLKTSTEAPRSVSQEPQVNLRISSDSTPETPGITGSSNGDSGNTNIFNPTRSVFLNGNSTLLEQLRSTVAPLLSSLGNKTPVFSGSYSNVNNANSPPRITPSGQPPRFSARYKGAELFVRKQNNVYQPTVPSITSSSTTPVTPVENSGSAPPIDVSSPGEPRFLTLYKALESVSVRNDQLQGNTSAREQVGSVPQVVSNATVADSAGNNFNNDTASPFVATISPQTPDTTANTTQDSTQTPRLSEQPENSTPAVTAAAPESPSSTESLSTSTESSSGTEQAFTATESLVGTEQMSTGTESSSEQASTSTESSFITEQVSTSTESLSDTEQPATGADLSSATEQISTNADSRSTSEQNGTEISARIADVTTTSSGSVDDVQTFSTVDNGTMNERIMSTSTDATTGASSEGSSTNVEGTSSIIGSNEMQSTTATASITQATQNAVESTTAVPTTITTTSENPDSNTIPTYESTTIQAIDITSTSAPTTEEDSNNIIDGETSTILPTTTVRNRLIDFAQDILSRLQASLSTTPVSSLDATTSSVTEISNAIPGSSDNNSLASLSQLREESTSTQRDVGTTTPSSVTTDQTSSRTLAEATTRSAVGSIDTLPPSMVSTEEANTQDEIDAFTSTPPTTVTVTATQDSQTVLTTASTIADDSNGSSSPPVDSEATTAPTVTSTDDTLLTELMSIAKTLLSEGVNDTERITLGGNSNVASSVGTLMENNVDRPSLSNDVLGTTQVAESSSISTDVSTESVDATSTILAMSEFSTFSVDPSQNEVVLSELATTASMESQTEASTLANPPNTVTADEMQSGRTTETTPLGLGPFADNVQTVTPSFTTDIGSQVTLSDRTLFTADTDPDTSTQSQTTVIATQSTETATASTANAELTTNTFNLFSSNDTIATTESQTASEQVTQSVTEFAESTVPVETNVATATPQLASDTNTNQPEVTTIAPEITASPVNTIATTPSVSSDTNTQRTTVTPTAEVGERVNVVDAETNPATESATQLAPLTTELTANETFEATTRATVSTTVPLDVSSTDDTAVSTNQSPLTSTAEPTMEIATNTPGERTNVPQTTPYLENDAPTVVAPFQDTTSATAQGTAGSGIGQTTEIGTSMIPDSSTTPPPTSTVPSSSSRPSTPLVATASSSVETTTPTMTTETTTTTTAMGRVTNEASSTPRATTISARADVFTVTPESETTVSTSASVDVEENLVSTQVTTTTTVSTEGSTATMQAAVTQGTMNETSSTTVASTTTQRTASPITSTPGASASTSSGPTATPFSQTLPSQQLGRFGGSRLTPAPRFSPSSTTRAPLRDYHVYGIYPNKTIVRKRPEDNLIDARNVDSPYVIFGIFPDGRLVRKFPNGTIIPDPPRSPVEVVFSLSTSTTTNRPPPRPYYNQANQGTYNLYRGPVYNNNGRPEPMRNVQSPGTVDLGLTGNAIVGPNGGGPANTGPLGTPASVPSTNEMSNAQQNTQMGTASVTPIVSTGRPATDLQGGRIVQDRERDEATRTKEAGGQRNSVYIGQDKFVNYWIDRASTTNPRVLSVNINSVASAINEGPTPSIPSFENLLNNQPGGQMTAPPGFPWRDPLDQIFGITTASPAITASVSSNTLDDSPDPNGSNVVRPINPYVEVFTPFSSTIGIPGSNVGTILPPTTTTSGTSSTTATAPSTTSTTTTTTTTPTTTTTTTTTTMPTTTTTTTTMPTTTTTTTTMPTTTTSTTTMPTTTTTTTTTTLAPTTTTALVRTTTPTAMSTQGTPATPSRETSFNLPNNLFNAQQQNAFGTTFDDLAFLNSLLQGNSRGTTQKTLTQVEQLLANKILSLALNNPGPTRAPKAVNSKNASPNSIFQAATKSPSEPIIIDLSPSSTAVPPTWKSVDGQQSTSQKTSSSAAEQATWKPVTTTTTGRDVEISAASSSTTAKTTLISTTKAPVTVTAKPVTKPRPRTTTQAPLGFGGLLWQALTGGNIFGTPTTAKPVKAKPAKTTPKSVNITPKPPQTTERTTTTTTTASSTILQTVDVSKIHVTTPESIIRETKLGITPTSISTTKQPLLNNPNPRLSDEVSSTYSPEEDAKFLVNLLRAVQQDNKGGASKKVAGLTQDDEAFLRSILSGRALTTTTPAPTTGLDNAALLAALLKARGIEPLTPATNLREQLLLASLGQSVTPAPAASPAKEFTTVTTKPASTTATTKKKAVTAGSSSIPRVRTTTWSPSSTYPPPLFSSFPNYGNPGASDGGNNPGNNALFGATRAFSQFLGAAISGAAQQLQSLVRNGSRIVSEVVG